MSMRISDAGLAVLLLLAGCGQSSDDPRVVAGALPAGDAAKGRIACRAGGAAGYSDSCTAERVATADGQLLTLRGPDGGFHRVLVAPDGRTVTSADGAEPAVATGGPDGATDVAVGGDRYRLPAVRGGPAPK